jgi:hypothetical protein
MCKDRKGVKNGTGRIETRVRVGTRREEIIHKPILVKQLSKSITKNDIKDPGTTRKKANVMISERNRMFALGIDWERETCTHFGEEE